MGPRKRRRGTPRWNAKKLLSAAEGGVADRKIGLLSVDDAASEKERRTGKRVCVAASGQPRARWGTGCPAEPGSPVRSCGHYLRVTRAEANGGRGRQRRVSLAGDAGTGLELTGGKGQ